MWTFDFALIVCMMFKLLPDTSLRKKEKVKNENKGRNGRNGVKKIELERQVTLEKCDYNQRILFPVRPKYEQHLLQEEEESLARTFAHKTDLE